ncbi:deoxyribonuclease II [Planoprotostelium fungivorum]|uniref:Deoxyribonuclease II n=1 Tax=Planoprotostelium fungivorum TaxID=1890364 RepID=A0A2P6N1I9_9EUKA|nr:deoxyribonuclease II [Planoprotostelium fungivorum]
MRVGLLLSVFVVGVFSLGCLDEAKRSVDWWVTLKLPTIPKGADSYAADGVGYAYADANSPSIKYTGRSLNDQGAISNTFGQIYGENLDPRPFIHSLTGKSGSNSMAYALYNDQSPDASGNDDGDDSDDHDSFGHLKGAFAFDLASGFWLLHSVPRYPFFTNSSYSFPQYAEVYGQSYICVSLPSTSIETVIKQLLYNKPFIYDMNIPSFLQKLPAALLLTSKKWMKGETNSTATLTTVKGQKLLHFAKTGKWGKDVYQDLVSKTLQSGLMVETWMNGARSNQMPTQCKPSFAYENFLIRDLSFGPGLSWKETNDHSKWAITTDRPGTVCIGDINKQFSQSKRGGGTLCLSNTQLWQSFKSIIINADQLRLMCDVNRPNTFLDVGTAIQRKRRKSFSRYPRIVLILSFLLISDATLLSDCENFPSITSPSLTITVRGCNKYSGAKLWFKVNEGRVDTFWMYLDGDFKNWVNTGDGGDGLNSAEMQRYRQNACPWTDEQGHIFGSRFGGRKGGLNVFPQLATVNRGAYLSWESFIAEQTKRNGMTVETQTVFSYETLTDLRPVSYSVEYAIYNGSTLASTGFCQFYNVNPCREVIPTTIEYHETMKEVCRDTAVKPTLATALKNVRFGRPRGLPANNAC